MTQAAKFIDVTRSYKPIDPNTFPESMHGTAKEDAPENRIPASAYAGHNFLPTNYGYKSYFGTNGKLDVDNLTSRIDRLFTFQTETFENLLIALAEDGIWIKNAGVTGAWTQALVKTAPVDPLQHYQWTTTVISDILYAYMQNDGQYYTITSLATAPYYTLTPVVPSFLNMAGQQGIFRAGGRLGFWDSADSVSWSSLDDLQDLTPSLETLAGNATFSNVSGRIVNIQGSGEGFIIYATKSIVYVKNTNDSTYQWDPQVLIGNTGIAYYEEVAVANPDTLQFAYTNTGIFKIENTQIETIVPEVYDFLKKAQKPIYPVVLEGRYLFFQILDQDFFNGLGQFSDEVVDGIQYFFPGNKTAEQAASDIIVTGQSPCSVIAAVNNGDFDEQQPGGTGGPPAIPDKKPGTKAKPIWKCWVSNYGVLDPADLTFGNTPCAVTDPNLAVTGMSPIGKSGRLDAMTQDTTNKTPLLGSDVYVDGIWTMERFVAVQTALWEKQDKTRKDLVNKILSRSATGAKTTDVPTCTEVPTAKSYCEIGDYVTNYSAPQFGFSACSFWLTRFALSAITIKTVKALITSCQFVPIEARKDNVTWTTTWNAGQATSALSCATQASSGHFSAAASHETFANYAQCYDTPGLMNNATLRNWSCPAGWSPVATAYITGDGGLPYTDATCTFPAHYLKTETMFAYNQGFYKDITPTPETAFCEIVGYEYTKVDNTTGTISVAGCSKNTAYPKPGAPPKYAGLPKDPNQPNAPIADSSGSMCSKPFEPVTIPGIPSTPVSWPDQIVTLPPGSFLLQKGSIAPVYPDFEGALVYDLYIKKWGVLKTPYKRLLDYQPLNDQSGGGIPYNRFGILGGVLKSNGGVYLFDDQPTDSVIKYGKLGYYRLGVTSVEEVRVHFASLCTGTLRVEGSLDGRNLGADSNKSIDYEDTANVTLTGGFPARWHNIVVSGIYDIQYMEYRAVVQGRRGL